MQKELMKIPDQKPISRLSVVRNFMRIIESRDISLMNKELYQFLNLYCGFIAHYNINGFKGVYAAPKDFADVFIRHFDKGHRFFDGIYQCHEEPYKDTGYSKADIKEEFYSIVEIHKGSIGKWADNRQREKRYAAYKALKEEFHRDGNGLKIMCDACRNEYEVRVLKEGEEFIDFGIICCLFCGQQIKLY